MVDLKNVDILDIIGRDSALKRAASTSGGEFAGPCPFCGGADRFRVWPEHSSGKGRWWCRACGKSGDAIQYLRDRDGLDFRQACEALEVGTDARGSPTPRRPSPRHAPTEAPSAAWQAQAEAFVAGCESALWDDAGAKGLAWLRGRGLSDATIRGAGLGFNARAYHDSYAAWGLAPDPALEGMSNNPLTKIQQQRPDPDGKGVWLDRGIVIPWRIGGELWKVNVRRASGDPKYIAVKGSKNALFNADGLHGALPVVLVEAELDVLLLQQEAGDLVAAVGTGSATGSRRPRWIASLASASMVLVAFDADEAGESASSYWLDVLGNAKRWRPFWGDATEMAQAGADLRAWLRPSVEPPPASGGEDLCAVCGGDPYVFSPKGLAYCQEHGQHWVAMYEDDGDSGCT